MVYDLPLEVLTCIALYVEPQNGISFLAFILLFPSTQHAFLHDNGNRNPNLFVWEELYKEIFPSWARDLQSPENPEEDPLHHWRDAVMALYANGAEVYVNSDGLDVMHDLWEKEWRKECRRRSAAERFATYDIF
jgi:hypothetical protein